MRIAIQGELGSFSHQAALKMEPQATIVPCALSRRFSSWWKAVRFVPRSSRLKILLPVRWSSTSIFFSSPTCKSSGNPCCASATISLAYPAAADRRIRQVLSHPVALAQCRRFFGSSQDDAHSLLRHRGQREACNRASATGRRPPSPASRPPSSTEEQVLAAGIEDNPATTLVSF